MYEVAVNSGPVSANHLGHHWQAEDEQYACQLWQRPYHDRRYRVGRVSGCVLDVKGCGDTTRGTYGGQYTNREYGGNTNLTAPRHSQSPYDSLWKKQYHQVHHYVEERGK